MCTRFYISYSDELAPYIDAAKYSPLTTRMSTILNRQFKDFGEVRPTDITAVIAPGRNGSPKVFSMVWGYHIDGINRPIVNARIESAKERLTFSSDWQKHRCVIPASYYFEWEHIKKPDSKTKTGQKYAIHPSNSSVTWLAGLYRIEETQGLYYPVFTVLTKEPTKELSRIHDRMPVILPSNAINEWIRPDANPENVVKSAITDMVMVKAQ